MNTLKTIYNKLGDKTELASHKIDLGIVQDISKATATYKDIPSFLSNSNDALVKFDKEYSAVKQQALELGINPETIPEIKNYYSIIKTLSDAVNKAIY